MRKLAISAALFALLGLPTVYAAAQGPGEGVGGDTQEQQQQTDPSAQNRGESDADRRVSQAVRQSIGTDDAASAVTVSTADSVVTLSGTVPSEAARERLVAATKKTTGVKEVDDELTIGTPPVGSGARGTPAGAGAGGSSGRGAP